MKIKSILLAGLVALGFAACNNEEVPQLPNGAEGTVSVQVIPSSKSNGSRATGDLSGDGISNPGLGAESTIKLLEVYVFDTGSGVIDGYGTSTSNKVEEIKTHAGAKTIMVVANAGTAIGQVANKAALEAKTNSMPVDISKGLVMTGEANVTLVAGQNYFGYQEAEKNHGAGPEHNNGTPLDIVRANARVALVSTVLQLPTPAPEEIPVFDALTDIQVAVFNVPQETKIFGNAGTLTTGITKFYFGQAWPTTSNSYVGSDVSDTNGEAKADFLETGLSLPVAIGNAPYFYVTENVKTGLSPKEQMLLVVRGKPTIGNPAVAVEAEGLYTDEDGYTYYPVWINKDGDITGSDKDGKVLRNTQYNIYLTIKGIGNPTIDEVKEAFLDVKVVVKPWEVVKQEVEWK